MEPTWQEPRTPGFSLLTPVVRALIYINCAVYLAVALIWVVTPAETFVGFYDGLARWFGVAPHAWSLWLPRVWQPLTYGFVHSLEPMHLLFNMLGLYFFGTMLEGIIGGRRFLGFFLGAVLVGGLLALVWTAFQTADATTVGASGGVLAVIVAMARLRPRTRVIFFVFPITIQTLALIFVGMDVFRLLTEIKGGGGGGVSFQAHLGGALFGFLAVQQRWIWIDPFEKLESYRAEKAQEREVAADERLDAILEKISREGIQSLTSAEKTFLKRASERKSG